MSIKLTQLRSGPGQLCPDAWDPLQMGSVGSTDNVFHPWGHSCCVVTVEEQGHFHLSVETETCGSSLNPKLWN